jgi:hypothetical protein
MLESNEGGLVIWKSLPCLASTARLDPRPPRPKPKPERPKPAKVKDPTTGETDDSPALDPLADFVSSSPSSSSSSLEASLSDENDVLEEL